MVKRDKQNDAITLSRLAYILHVSHFNVQCKLIITMYVYIYMYNVHVHSMHAPLTDYASYTLLTALGIGTMSVQATGTPLW